MRMLLAVTVPLLIVAALVTAFLLTHERREDEVYTGFSGEAARNPFYAAQRLLEELGIDAESRVNLVPTEWLPPSSDTLLLQGDAELAAGDALTTLYDWVAEEGGHLVLLAPVGEGTAAEPLFHAFGLGFSAPDAEVAIGVAPEPDEALPEAAAYALSQSYPSRRLLIHGLPDTDDTDGMEQDLVSVADEHGYLAVRLPVGNGFVTAVATAGFFSNASIDRFDHARLFLDILAGYVEPGKVWLIYGVAYPSLLALIWQAVPELTLMLVLLLLLWLWAAMPRFGPRIVPPAEDRRSVLEHVKAAGAFAWRHDGAETLTAAVRNALIDAADRRHPGIARLSAKKQAERIAHLTGRSAAEVYALLEPEAVERPADFANAIHELKELRKSL